MRVADPELEHLELAAVLDDAVEDPAQDVRVDEVAFQRDGLADHGCDPSARLRASEGQALLGLVLALLVRVRGLARLVALEEEDLRDALVRRRSSRAAASCSKPRA